MRCPRLAELPSPPEGREGWPWTEECPPLPDEMPDGRRWPRISVTTPSYEQGRFLEETIRSVLLQGYPDIEFFIADGGSKDGSVRIIEKYAPWLTYWTSEPDHGQSHAVNKGWERSTGDLIVWLCSDDTYLPATMVTVARAWDYQEDVSVVTGGIRATDERSRPGGSRHPVVPPTPADVSVSDDLETFRMWQPPSFFSRAHLDGVGRWLREDLQYTMDREVLYRLCRSGRVIVIPEVLATYRQHEASKTEGFPLEQALELPKAFDYCTWGGREAVARRRELGRRRIAMGHYAYAVRCPSRWDALRHLFAAARVDPSYLSPRRMGAVRILLNAIGLLRPAQAAKRMIRGTA